MITITKLKEYEQYQGFYDGFYLQKVKKGLNITSDDEWYLMRDLIQDLKLVNKNLASKEYEENLNKKLKENCDNEETITQLKKLAEEEW
jgi:hypothetical protein